MSSLRPPPKHLRQLHASLLSLHATLIEEQCLLERIWYKSHAQFRAQKWFRSIDAVRRGLRDVLGKRRGYERNERSSKRRDGDSGRAVLVDVLKNVATTYYSLSPDGPPTRLDPFQKLPKLSFKSSPPYTTTHTFTTLLSTFQLLHLLTSLQLRTHAAVSALVTHLRTPPAPTFAPVVLVLMSVVAKVHSVCREAITGEGGESTSENSEAKPPDLIKSYHILIDVVKPSKEEDTAIAPTKRKRGTNDQDPIPLEINRYPHALQALLNSTQPSIDSRAISHLPRRIAPHRSTLTPPSKKRRKYKLAPDGLPALKQLAKQRRTLLDEYERGGKVSRGSNSTSASDALLKQFSLGALGGGDEDEDVGLAV